MVAMGEQSYVDSCKEIVGAARRLSRSLIEEVPEIKLLGEPKVSVVAFTSDVVNILEVGDRLSKKGWHRACILIVCYLHHITF